MPSVPLLGRRLFSRSSTRRPRPSAILVSPISVSKRCLSLVLSLARSPPPPSFSLTLRFGQRRGSKKAAARPTARSLHSPPLARFSSHVRHVGALHYARGLFRSFSGRPGPALSLSLHPLRISPSFLPSLAAIGKRPARGHAASARRPPSLRPRPAATFASPPDKTTADDDGVRLLLPWSVFRASSTQELHSVIYKGQIQKILNKILLQMGF